MSYPMDEAANLAQQAAIAINMKKKGKKPKRMNEGSLHKWFKGSKSKDGKGGWVNVVTGGTCASDEPGEGTPKCVSSSKRASMSKKERLSASRRKKKADPGQQSKTGAAKPTYVSTDKKKKMTEELEYIDLPLEVEIPNSESKFNLGLMFRESLDIDKGMLFIFEEVGQHSFHMKNTRIPLDVAFVKEDGTIESIKELNPHTLLPVSSDGEVLFAIEANRGWFIENNVEVGDEIVLGEAKDKKGKGSGSKDACYHKVKSRYSVWPSAYASGALVKCRKVGAANWGNKSESYEINPVAHKAAQKKSKMRNLAIGNTNPNEKAAAEKKAGGPKLIGEEGYDVARDQGRVSPSKDKKDATTMPPSAEMKKTQKVNKGPSALDRVKAKYGKSVMKMGEELDSKDKPFVKDLVKKLRGGSKTHAKQADDLEKAVNEDIKRDEYGDPVGGPKISKKQKAKNLASNTPDEQHTTTTSEEKLDEKCWPGYEKKGMKTMFGKRYPNCVKKKVKKEEYSDWRHEIETQSLQEYSTLVRQGIKVGGKKGGRAVQAGEKAVIAKGRQAQTASKQGNQSKMVGSGRFEKAGAIAGGLTGAVAGGLVDGPLPIGDIVGGIAGSKVGGKIGRQFDKIGAKKPVKEENLDEGIVDKIKKFGEYLAPTPGKGTSNEPSVAAGTRTPKSTNMFKHVPSMNKDGTTGQYGKKGTTAIKQGAEKGINSVKDKAGDFAKNQGMKVVKNVAAPAAAGLAVSKGVDALMKRGKNTQKESFSNWRDEVGYEDKDSSKKIDEDWQKVNRKDKTDGLSQKAVNAYRKENPGSKLKTAVTKDPKKLKKGSKSAKRRLSFCRRMKGMKKKLTSAKTSRDPDSRINKALRRWNCSYEPTGTTITEKSVSKKQQRFFGIVRAAQKGTLEGEASPQIQRAAASMTKKDVKKYASTDHKGLPEKVKSEE